MRIIMIVIWRCLSGGSRRSLRSSPYQGQSLKEEVALEDFKDWHTCPTQVATQTVYSYPCLETDTNASTPAYDHSGPAWSYRPFAKRPFQHVR